MEQWLKVRHCYSWLQQHLALVLQQRDGAVAEGECHNDTQHVEQQCAQQPANERKEAAAAKWSSVSR
jgi:hypothetical protein